MMNSMLLSRAASVFFFKLLILISCINNTDKANVEELNKDRFSSSDDRKEAQFLVDAVDDSYAILEVAQLGEERLTNAQSRDAAKKIVELQGTVAARLKTFAESSDVSIPLSGPEKTKNRVQNLYNKQGVDFERSWKKQLGSMNGKLLNDLERYRDNASASLQHMLDSTLTLMRQNESLITQMEEQDQE